MLTKKNNNGVVAALPSVPDEHLTINNRLMSKLCDSDTDFGTFDFDTGSKSQPMINHCSVHVDNPILNIPKNSIPIGPFDREVYDSVVSLYVCGHRLITELMIYRAMCGNLKIDSITDNQSQNIRTSLIRLSNIFIELDISEEIKHRFGSYTSNSDPKNQKYFSGHLLELCDDVLEYNDAEGVKTKSAWRITAEPVLYSYASLINQIISVHDKIWDIKDKKNKSVINNSSRIIIKGYLLRRINTMVFGITPVTNRIKFQSILDLIPYTDNRTQLKRYRDYIFTVLDYWKKIHYIEGYKINKRVNTIYSIDIEYSDHPHLKF